MDVFCNPLERTKFQKPAEMRAFFVLGRLNRFEQTEGGLTKLPGT
ncbi:hypothetical protein SAMN05660429_01891 [Thalassotalea agarivorans]|uniref:Uncharacterized protein n=1 Tax=Thalassotalea agarivorans TaxID=349064 RepID=A0A1I0ESB5_THASX|nr:hypothetical protein SAMN05660429_01891 [Thalassotalea agarivorans]